MHILFNNSVSMPFCSRSLVKGVLYWWKKNEIMQIWNNLTNFSHQNKHQTAYKKNYMIKLMNQNKINVGIGKFYLCFKFVE
jgi:hypothetical protein